MKPKREERASPVSLHESVWIYVEPLVQKQNPSTGICKMCFQRMSALEVEAEHAERMNSNDVW